MNVVNDKQQEHDQSQSDDPSPPPQPADIINESTDVTNIDNSKNIYNVRNVNNTNGTGDERREGFPQSNTGTVTNKLNNITNIDNSEDIHNTDNVNNLTHSKGRGNKDKNKDGVVDEQDDPAYGDTNEDGVVDEHDDPAHGDTNEDGVVDEYDDPADKDTNEDGVADEHDDPADKDTNEDGVADEHDDPADKDTNEDGAVDEHDDPADKDTNEDGVVDEHDDHADKDTNEDGAVDEHDDQGDEGENGQDSDEQHGDELGHKNHTRHEHDKPSKTLEDMIDRLENANPSGTQYPHETVIVEAWTDLMLSDDEIEDFEREHGVQCEWIEDEDDDLYDLITPAPTSTSSNAMPLETNSEDFDYELMDGYHFLNNVPEEISLEDYGKDEDKVLEDDFTVPDNEVGAMLNDFSGALPSAQISVFGSIAAAIATTILFLL